MLPSATLLPRLGLLPAPLRLLLIASLLLLRLLCALLILWLTLAIHTRGLCGLLLILVRHSRRLVCLLLLLILMSHSRRLRALLLLLILVGHSRRLLGGLLSLLRLLLLRVLLWLCGALLPLLLRGLGLLGMLLRTRRLVLLLRRLRCVLLSCGRGLFSCRAAAALFVVSFVVLCVHGHHRGAEHERGCRTGYSCESHGGFL